MRNMQWQTLEDSKVKDRWECKLSRSGYATHTLHSERTGEVTSVSDVEEITLH